MIKKRIDNNIEKKIQDSEDFLNVRYKELDDILNSNTNKNNEYIEYLNNEIDILEKELKFLKKQKNLEKDNKKNNKESVINNRHEKVIDEENVIDTNLDNKDKTLKNNNKYINHENSLPIYKLENIIDNMITDLDEKAVLIKKEIDIVMKMDNNKQNIIINLKKDLNNIICKAKLLKYNFYDCLNNLQ